MCVGGLESVTCFRLVGVGCACPVSGSLVLCGEDVCVRGLECVTCVRLVGVVHEGHGSTHSRMHRHSDRETDTGARCPAGTRTLLPVYPGAQIRVYCVQIHGCKNSLIWALVC